jgi:hypothetical protein
MKKGPGGMTSAAVALGGASIVVGVEKDPLAVDHERKVDARRNPDVHGHGRVRRLLGSARASSSSSRLVNGLLLLVYYKPKIMPPKQEQQDEQQERMPERPITLERRGVLEPPKNKPEDHEDPEQ